MGVAIGATVAPVAFAQDTRKVLVIPNLTAPYGQDTAVHLPPDGTWLSTVYYDHNSAGTGGGSFGPNGFGEASADETIRC